MKEIICSNFDEFLKSHESYFEFDDLSSQLLFRGQNKSNFGLTTTLERFGYQTCSVWEYSRIISCCMPELKSLDRDIQLLELRELEGDYPRYWDDYVKVPQITGGIEAFIALRHFGFPSPLLDWTRSPYIAAYFACACNSGFELAADLEDAAIFVYQELLDGGKGGWQFDAKISQVGRYVETADRHHVQQADYTVCYQRISDDNGGDKGEDFCPYPTGDNSSASQDRLLKFVLPGDVRRDVLDQLDLMNVNAYTLFGGREALMKSAAWRHMRPSDMNFRAKRRFGIAGEVDESDGA